MININCQIYVCIKWLLNLSLNDWFISKLLSRKTFWIFCCKLTFHHMFLPNSNSFSYTLLNKWRIYANPLNPTYRIDGFVWAFDGNPFAVEHRYDYRFHLEVKYVNRMGGFASAWRSFWHVWGKLSVILISLCENIVSENSFYII